MEHQYCSNCGGFHASTTGGCLIQMPLTHTPEHVILPKGELARLHAQLATAKGALERIAKAYDYSRIEREELREIAKTALKEIQDVA